MLDRKLHPTLEIYISTLFKLAAAYYDGELGQQRSTGGCLHVWLDDGNWWREDIQFCLKYAEEQKDRHAVLIAQIGLMLTDEELRYYQDWERLGHPSNNDWIFLGMCNALEDLCR